MQTATAGSRALKPLANERDVHVHQKVVAPFVIERVVAVHEVDDDAGARAPCLHGGFDARRIAEAVVGREPPLCPEALLWRRRSRASRPRSLGRGRGTTEFGIAISVSCSATKVRDI